MEGFFCDLFDIDKNSQKFTEQSYSVHMLTTLTGYSNSIVQY